MSMKISPIAVNYTPTNENVHKVLMDFCLAARAAGWTQHQIDVITEECFSGDYNNLISTIFMHCKCAA